MPLLCVTCTITHDIFGKLTFWELILWEIDIMGVDILGVGILGFGILRRLVMTLVANFCMGFKLARVEGIVGVPHT